MAGLPGGRVGRPQVQEAQVVSAEHERSMRTTHSASNLNCTINSQGMADGKIPPTPGAADKVEQIRDFGHFFATTPSRDLRRSVARVASIA